MTTILASQNPWVRNMRPTRWGASVCPRSPTGSLSECGPVWQCYPGTRWVELPTAWHVLLVGTRSQTQTENVAMYSGTPRPVTNFHYWEIIWFRIKCFYIPKHNNSPGLLDSGLSSSLSLMDLFLGFFTTWQLLPCDHSKERAQEGTHMKTTVFIIQEFCLLFFSIYSAIFFFFFFFRGESLNPAHTQNAEVLQTHEYFEAVLLEAV